VRWPLLIILLTYAILQPAIYRFEIVEHMEVQELSMFEAAGKLSIFVAITVAVISASEEQSKTWVRTIQVAVWLISAGFGIFVLGYRFLEWLAKVGLG